MNGAATSSLMSKLSLGFRPGALKARAISRSASALAGLSRRFCIAWVTDHQASNSASQRHSARFSPASDTRTTGAVVGLAMRCAHSVSAWRSTRSANAARSSRAICTTAPSSSLNRLRNGSSPQASRVMSRPSREVKAISHSAAKAPPSLRSW